MRTLAIMLVFVIGCVPASERVSSRWPDHRKQHDSALADLKVIADRHEAELAELRAKLDQLQKQIAAAPAPP